jgi:DNA modification methylase
MFLTPPTLIETNKLRTHPNNPRFIRKEKLESLKRSISEDPKLLTVRPLLVNPQMEVFAGNQRLRACIELEWEAIPCHVLDWTEEEQRRAMIKDNAAAGEWDQDMLANEWEVEELKDMGLDLDWDEPEETEGLTDPDDVPEVPEEPTTKPSDLWILGDHRLLCGDSTKAEDVERLMNGEKADMVFTDPPYGMRLNADYSSAKARPDMAKAKGLLGGKKWDNVIGDHEDFTAELIHTIFKCFPHCKEVFLWGADYYAELLPNKNEGSWLVWDKRLEESTDKMYGSCFELCWSKNKHKRDIARVKWAGVFGVEQEHDRQRSHPTQKPTALAQWFFERWGNKGDIVADIYAGSGFTFLAAEKTGRKCYGMELDPKYCDVIVKRWEDFTGKKAELWKQ